jgi:hypothetical protein
MKRQFTIKIQKEARSRIDEVAKSIAKIGAKVDKTMSKIGVISATMDETLECEVRAVKDVQMIRPSKMYSVAPPGASTH